MKTQKEISEANKVEVEIFIKLTRFSVEETPSGHWQAVKIKVSQFDKLGSEKFERIEFNTKCAAQEKLLKMISDITKGQ